MKNICLSKGLETIVDDADFKYLSNFKWFANKAGKCFYASRMDRFDGRVKILRMHRLILNLDYGNPLLVDHINGNSLDNRRCNLRLSNKQLNGMNRPKNKSKSPFKGVTFDTASGFWISQININGKHIVISRFSNPVDAAKAYDQKAKKLFGEHAYLNFGEKIE